MKKVLFIGDAVTPTGFGTVINNIIVGLPKKEFDVSHLGINYYGDPHEFGWKIFPATLGGDIWGFGRLREMMAVVEPDVIFILNDIWVIDRYLEELKKLEIKLPPIIIYFPIDSMFLDSGWFKHQDIITSINVYTQFARNEIIKLGDSNLTRDSINVIPHGVNNKDFYKIDLPKREIKKQVYPDREDFLDSFIVLNANRNQPRKRLDLTLEAFALFADKKPENVKLYAHCGIKDAGFDIIRLAYRYGIDKRLIITSKSPGIQRVPLDKLNLIYNATDVGVNTSIGEGWGLISHEHAATGAPQIVPGHSACFELFHDCGSIVPVTTWLANQDTSTVSGYIKAEDLAESLQELYDNKELFDTLAKKGYEKFSSKEYTWEYIVKTFWLPMFREVTK